MRVAGRSRKGAGEGPNEDSIGWDETRSLALVADGMGGHSRGEVASALVKETLLDSAANANLKDAALRAHERILQIAGAEGGASGMGSTLVAVSIADRVGKAVWVGDSRAYL